MANTNDTKASGRKLGSNRKSSAVSKRNNGKSAESQKTRVRKPKLGVDKFSENEIGLLVTGLGFAENTLSAYDPENENEFAEILRLCVKASQVGQVEIAKELGVTTGTFSRWLNGDTIPPAYARAGIRGHLLSFLRTQGKEAMSTLNPPKSRDDIIKELLDACLSDRHKAA